MSADRGSGSQGAAPSSALPWLAAAVFVLLAAVLMRALLPACGALPFFGGWFADYCPTAQRAPSSQIAAALSDDRAALEDDIAALEREIAGLDCPAGPAQQAALPDPEPERESTIEEALEDQDLRSLAGCWTLNSDYRVRDVETDEVYPVTDWKVCLDEQGNGSQDLVFGNGTTCKGPVKASFTPDGRLILRDQGDVPCSRGFRIFERETSCRAGSSGQAQCESRSVNRNDGRTRVEMRRQQSQGE
ncbi:MAG: hypothetical protein MRY63_09530 [Neomegalonema sp.]|nr:hypothetical protein [Neomegalonema sp.]